MALSATMNNCTSVLSSAVVNSAWTSITVAVAIAASVAITVIHDYFYHHDHNAIRSSQCYRGCCESPSDLQSRTSLLSPHLSLCLVTFSPHCELNMCAGVVAGGDCLEHQRSVSEETNEFSKVLSKLYTEQLDTGTGQSHDIFHCRQFSL